jgi:hypothetical protein
MSLVAAVLDEFIGPFDFTQAREMADVPVPACSAAVPVKVMATPAYFFSSGNQGDVRSAFSFTHSDLAVPVLNHAHVMWRRRLRFIRGPRTESHADRVSSIEY